MFNNNNSARENSFMGDSNNTIGNIHQDKTINSTSPNLSDIYHLIHCLTLPPSMGERTYANTGYFSTTSLGLSRSQVEILVTPSYQQSAMWEYLGNWLLFEEFRPSHTGSTTSLGLSRSQVEILVTPSYQQPVMCEYLGNWLLLEEFRPSYTGINMNNYNIGGNV